MPRKANWDTIDLKPAMQSGGGGPVVHVRHIKESELAELSPEILEVIPSLDDGKSIFMVAAPGQYAAGKLARHGHWKDNNHILRPGVQYLVLQNLKADISVLCNTLLTEQTTYAQVERERKMQKKQQHFSELKVDEEVVDEEAELPRNRRGGSFHLNTALETEVLIVDNSVLSDADAALLGGALGSRNTLELEGCRCTLKTLYLCNNMLRESGVERLTSTLPHNTSISNLHVGFNNIGDGGANAIFQANLSRTVLQTLKLGGNLIADQGLALVPAFLESMSNLVVLHLNNNMIGDVGARYLAQGLALSDCLQVLNLNGNRIRDPGLEIMSHALIGGAGTRAQLIRIFGNHPRSCSGHRPWAPNTSLKALHLASNWLRDPGADRIAAILEGNWNLTNVELASNRIGDEGARALADALRYSMLDPSNNKVPRKICLSCNNLSSIGLRELQIALAKSGNIHAISVEGMRCNVGRRAAVQKENAQVADASFDARFPAQRLRLEAIRPTTPRADQQASKRLEAGKVLPSLAMHSAREAKERGPSRGQMPPTPGRGSGSQTERYLDGDASPKLRLTRGIGDYLMLNLDDDPKFQALCERLEVPVADMQRSKLRELDARQKEQRTRIYDRFLDLHAKHPRPYLNAAMRVQSLFKINQSKKEALETRARNAKRMLAKESEAFKAEAELKSVDVMAKATATMLEPLLNRLWTAWKTYLEHASRMRNDVVDLYAAMCTSMGVTASGCNALKTYMGSPFDIKLDLKGLGMLPHSARALSFIFRGLNCCKLCRGVGIINSDSFLAVRSDYEADRRTAGEIFDLIDADGSGSIDQYELAVAFRQMGVELATEEVIAIIKEGDTGDDLLIDKQEFKELFEKLKTGVGKSRCALCGGKGHSGELAVVEGPVQHPFVPVLKAREMLGYDSLEQLHLSGNCLRQAGTADIVDVLIQLQLQIKVLTLAGNELDETAAAEVSRLFTCPELALLECDMSHNALGDGGVQALAEAIAVCTTLLSLNLSKTACGSAGAQALGHMFEQNRSLTDLDVSWNAIGGVGAVALCNGLANSRTLLRLSAQWNGFCDLHAMVALSEALATSCCLKHLNLSQNRINNQGALVLAEGLKTNAYLLELVMSGNPLTVYGARSLLRCAQMGAGEADHLRSIQLNNCAVGILDMSMFNPVEPSGRYSLDMENEYSRRVLRNVLKLIAEGRAEFEHDHVLQIMEVLRVDTAGNPILHPVTGIQEHDVVSSHVRLPCFMNKQEFDARGETESDPLLWEIPTEGMIEFSLNDLGGRRARNNKLASNRHNLLRDEFRDGAVSMERKMQSFHKALPVSTFISHAQFQVLLAELRHLNDGSWLRLVAEGFYKVTGDIPARDVLVSLEPAERKQAEKALGFVTFEFSKNNPTGYYHLDLSNPKQRRVAIELVECKTAQAVTEKRIKDFSAGTSGAARDLEQRAWRNAVLDNKPFPFQRNLKIPKRGQLSLDFVQMTRTDPSTIDPMSDGYFKALIKELLETKEDAITQLQAMRLASHKQYFSVAQVAEFMDMLKADPKSCFQPRVELMVLAYARTVDYYALYHLVAKLLPFERHQVYHRIGHENIFEETMAVNYYELDLADSGQRYVAQQVIQLAITEPGENCIELMYEGCDFEVPASWTTSVPRSGQLRLYYVRERHVMDKVIKYGTSDIRKTNPFFYASAFGDFLPKWMRPYCPKGYPQPTGKDWIKAFKLRLVKSKIQERVALDAREAFEAIDQDGSGELSRSELLMSLFRMGVWLHQSEANALVTTLDEDSTGLIDVEEFQKFWDAHTYD